MRNTYVSGCPLVNCNGSFIGTLLSRRVSDGSRDPLVVDVQEEWEMQCSSCGHYTNRRSFYHMTMEEYLQDATRDLLLVETAKVMRQFYEHEQRAMKEGKDPGWTKSHEDRFVVVLRRLEAFNRQPTLDEVRAGG